MFLVICFFQRAQGRRQHGRINLGSIHCDPCLVVYAKRPTQSATRRVQNKGEEPKQGGFPCDVRTLLAPLHSLQPAERNQMLALNPSAKAHSPLATQLQENSRPCEGPPETLTDLFSSISRLPLYMTIMSSIKQTNKCCVYDPSTKRHCTHTHAHTRHPRSCVCQQSLRLHDLMI